MPEAAGLRLRREAMTNEREGSVLFGRSPRARGRGAGRRRRRRAGRAQEDAPGQGARGVVLRVRLDAAGNPDWSSAAIDDAERERRLQEARERVQRLRRTDPGGDVRL